MKKYKIKNNGIIHQIASCKDCNWTNQDYKNNLQECTRHVIETGHIVSREICISKTIYPREVEDLKYDFIVPNGIDEDNVLYNEQDLLTLNE